MRDHGPFNAFTIALFLTFALPIGGEPVTVHRIQGYVHGFVVLKDLNDKVLASGNLTQTPSGGRVSTKFVLNFKDGSLYEETAVYLQRHVFHLLSYRQVEKGPSFKTPETLSFDTSTGNVTVEYTDKEGKAKVAAEQLSLPDDLANGILSMLIANVDPAVETTLSMVVSTPKPRLVKLKISASGEDFYSVAGSRGKATRYTIKVDIGGVTGVVAKVAGKAPPPMYMWVAASGPAFLKSEGPLYEDGPVWRIELASPSWPEDARRK